MCGRFAQVIKHDRLQKLEKELLLSQKAEQIELNYNVAPTQTVAAVLSQDVGRYFGTFRWGLIPSWSRDIPKFNLINVRSETITEKPSFRGGLQRRRCLVPANGFYEWRQSDKQPFFIHDAGDDLLYLAGIYDAWFGPDGSFIPSLGIITTEANAAMQSLHQRMPVLLFGSDRLDWLDHTLTDALDFVPLLKPAPDEAIALQPVSRFVNKVGNNSEECLLPV
ncbi:MAG: SOS response-associated peptidase [Candidatus Syntrophosphaera sp.]|nr:SOS response-associated peptidase [Candidatus Syntrophosphaera sp.]